jgi:hypothetical protein
MEDQFKYPRTHHIPGSPGATNDDKILKDLSCFIGKTVVRTQKMDGENTTMKPEKIHARSLDSNDHPSRHWVKGLWGQIQHEIPEGWRICGENLYAQHSLVYTDLPSYFMAFSVWDEFNFCLSWKETVSVCEMLNLTTVPVIDIFLFDEKKLYDYVSEIDTTKVEGFVIRNIESFHYDNFSSNVAKWVRPKHVTTDQHWMFSEVIPNTLKK